MWDGGSGVWDRVGGSGETVGVRAAGEDGVRGVQGTRAGGEVPGTAPPVLPRLESGRGAETAKGPEGVLRPV
ncbi:hypothetical protein GCM10017600_04130 [Streptosporangium carneum]|uniref:Uncharacterized protein n=1 Tax=Streptosporangium carneum TaxID=47481 RepID=A0A9W6HVW6_9ACTN|nr:hypothetical protein GCM10017600_04130 [Streptosporangium carneum]